MKKATFVRMMSFALCAILLLPVLALASCGERKEKILIYSSAEDYRIEHMQKRLNEEFPQYDIKVEYKSTGDHAAQLLAEGAATGADISHEMEYGYVMQMIEKGYFADASAYDRTIYDEDLLVIEGTNYVPELRNGGAIIINTEKLSELGLEKPESYADLLDAQYKGLISMPSPKASGTGYMFLKSLVNEWGEDEAFAYFDALAENVLAFTSSGSGPVNALKNGEVVIGLGMTSQAVEKIKEGVPLEILYFEEGSPYSLYAQGIIKGKEERACVKEVFDFLVNTYTKENNDTFFPERIYKSGAGAVEGYPADIQYSDMSNNTFAEKERLLAKWKH